ncbi:Uncharacterized protein BM_BM17178 [Brugia malayi]|uniref:Bm7990 n=4 Tax=Brugia malayi TaxID=6279 RepID=A0A158PUZ2_BRUMA|nr:Uncharacterized protein BM_BM17145 [Brugia malayi]XP_042938892.1 Uncharacterized protein BM_BM17176 [Brugia malayi]XP_042938893.1 Uncharacterized protein BM_BM17177 [Brugia malayi]XP_042938894.1 Uncharacterized protein BM_BM17178 [Brugia malayi]VIP00132.1 Uncharacterized protein BM_BM17145 [Brugia malayi]VIP00249.1 Uncharacterized protein BM_BM17176 [Brugia malayi]VIP00250.1 Uncharacterized protein BM_BM17177 [Brugia malayi]VIP00251.1 Uncharacterized protein BM_BM17178 [Brugia malayi]
MVEEKNRFEMLFTSTKSKLNGLREVITTQFSENNNCFSSLMQKLNEKWSKGLDEMQKMASKMKIMHEYTEKNFKSLSVLLDCLHDREIKQLENNEREGDTFKKICEHCEEVMQELKRTAQHFRINEEDIRYQSSTLFENLDFGSEITAAIIRAAENLTKENDELKNENAELRNTIFILEKENIDLKEMRKMSIVQEKKFEEVEHRLDRLREESERLIKACYDEDEEVDDLKNQISEWLNTNH